MIFMKSDVLQTAIKAARAGGAVLKQYYRTEITVNEKEDGSFVSMVDHTAERVVLNEIQKKFPTHSIFSEEIGFIDQKSGSVWYIDPLDGTTNFLRHLPFFCVSIALESDGLLEVGVVYDPLHDEIFTAQRGKGAFLNGKELRIKDAVDYDKAFIATSRGRRTADKQNINAIKAVLDRSVQGTRHPGSAALELAYLAASRFDAYIACGVKRFDVYAGLVIAEEAGARIFKFGKEKDLSLTAPVYVAASAKSISEKLFKDIRKAVK